MKQVINKVILYFISNTKERLTKFLNGIKNKENSKLYDTMEKETVLFTNTSNISMNKIENKLTIKNSVNDDKSDEGSNYNSPDRKPFNILNKPINQNIDKDSFPDVNSNSKENNDDLNEKQSVKIEKSSNNNFYNSIKYSYNNNDDISDDKKNETNSNLSDNRKTLPIRRNTAFNILATKPFLLQDNDNKVNNSSDLFHTKKRNKKIIFNKK